MASGERRSREERGCKSVSTQLVCSLFLPVFLFNQLARSTIKNKKKKKKRKENGLLFSCQDQ